MTYRESVEWLYASQLFGIRLGLETMRRLCAALDIDPGVAPAVDRQQLVRAFPAEPEIVGLQQRAAMQQGNPERPIFIHVAGTNGKGSVCAMLDAILRVAGWRTGLYTSPHLVTFRERIRLNGEMISEDDVAAGLTRIRELISGWEPAPTFFEIVTALALHWFQEQHVHIAVLETGLGGRLDATNVVTPVVSVLTPIARDHEKYLGATLAEIAAEKAGIIKPGVPVASSAQSPEVRAVAERVAAECGTVCRFIDGADATSPGLIASFLAPRAGEEIALEGSHQRANAQLAKLALVSLKTRQPPIRVDGWHVQEGLQRVEWPGRFQWVRERFILDGAHNPAAATQLAITWREVFAYSRPTLILGVMRDKDVRGVCAALAPIAARVFAVTVKNPRSCAGSELAQAMSEVAPTLEVRAFSNLREALAAAEPHGGIVLIAGSLFLVGEALVALGLAEADLESSAQ